MAFRQGEENEALLVCRKCKGAYPIDALFCGFCGATRSIALGVEKDPNVSDYPIQFRPSDTLPAKETFSPKSPEVAPQSELKPEKSSKKSKSGSSALPDLN
jgi:hypothetical protein